MTHQVIDCPTCGGTGYNYKLEGYDSDGQEVHERVTCDTCNGEGWRDLTQKAIDFEADCAYDLEHDK